MRAAFPALPMPFASGPLNQRIEVGGLDLLLLDSSVPGKPHGELDAPTLQWLDATLASSPDRPALLFLHHPPFKAGIWHMDRQNLLNAGELAPIVRRHPRVQLIATGHVHRATLTMFAGVPTTICPAPNHAVDLDLAELREPSFKVEPPAFHLHTWFPGEGFGTVGHPSGADRGFRRAASVFRAGWEVAVRTIRLSLLHPEQPRRVAAEDRRSSACPTASWWRRRGRPDAVPRGSDGRCRARPGWRRPAPPDAASPPA